MLLVVGRDYVRCGHWPHNFIRLLAVGTGDTLRHILALSAAYTGDFDYAMALGAIDSFFHVRSSWAFSIRLVSYINDMKRVKNNALKNHTKVIL